MGILNYKHGSYAPDGVGLFISILLRYPEVGSIHYWQELQALKFTFMVAEKGQISGFRSKLTQALEVFHDLEGGEMRICEVDCRREEQVRLVTITRDAESMTQTEVGLIVEFVKAQFAMQLVYEGAELPEEEMLFQEEVISQMLATLQATGLDNIVAVREEGRVLVFKN